MWGKRQFHTVSLGDLIESVDEVDDITVLFIFMLDRVKYYVNYVKCYLRSSFYFSKTFLMFNIYYFITFHLFYF